MAWCSARNVSLTMMIPILCATSSDGFSLSRCRHFPRTPTRTHSAQSGMASRTAACENIPNKLLAYFSDAGRKKRRRSKGLENFSPVSTQSYWGCCIVRHRTHAISVGLACDGYSTPSSSSMCVVLLAFLLLLRLFLRFRRHHPLCRQVTSVPMMERAKVCVLTEGNSITIHWITWYEFLMEPFCILAHHFAHLHWRYSGKCLYQCHFVRQLMLVVWLSWL